MAIELVPKPKAKPKRIVNILFYLSLIFLILTVTSYFGLYSIKDKKEQELKDLKIRLTAQETPELRRLQKDLKEYEKKVNDLSLLISSYREPTEFFKFIEDITHSRVEWSNLGFDPSGSEWRVSVSGRAENLIILIQQILFLENHSRIKEISLNSFSLLEEGGATFGLEFFVSH